jgi:hypothetical protein
MSAVSLVEGLQEWVGVDSLPSGKQRKGLEQEIARYIMLREAIWLVGSDKR